MSNTTDPNFITKPQEWGPAPPPDEKKMVDPNSPSCLACGRYHGQVNVMIRCLSSALLSLKEENRQLKAALEPPKR